MKTFPTLLLILAAAICCAEEPAATPSGGDAHQKSPVANQRPSDAATGASTLPEIVVTYQVARLKI